MSARRLFAWSVYTAFTAPIGLLAHFAFEALSRRDGGFSPFEPDHLALIGVIAGAIVLAVSRLRRGTPDERRARLAMLRASMPQAAGLVGATCAVQLPVAAVTFALENVAVDPARAGVAALFAIAAVLAGAIAFLFAEDAILRSAAGLNLPWVAANGDSVLLDFAVEPRVIGCVARRRHGGRSPPFGS